MKNLRHCYREVVAKVGMTPLQIIIRMSCLHTDEIVHVRHPFFLKRFSCVKVLFKTQRIYPLSGGC